MELSVILPIYNESESLPVLIKQISDALSPHKLAFEILCIDDGSTDDSFSILRTLSESYPEIVAVQLRRNFGQTAAMQAGIDLSRGQFVTFLDADLQNDPADIPLMLNKIKSEKLDIVAGWRKDRQDTFLSRRLPSIIANRLISATTSVKLHDYGCSLKVLTRETAKLLKLYGEMHRFIPALADWNGARIAEVPVNHRARQFGTSKYGIGRTIRVILDLIVVMFVKKFSTKPMHVFGLTGLLTFGCGFALCVWLTMEKLLWGHPLGDRPLLLLGALLIVVGAQMLSMGLIADILMRTYFESQEKAIYTIREVCRQNHQEEIQ